MVRGTRTRDSSVRGREGVRGQHKTENRTNTTTSQIKKKEKKKEKGNIVGNIDFFSDLEDKKINIIR